MYGNATESAAQVSQDECPINFHLVSPVLLTFTGTPSTSVLFAALEHSALLALPTKSFHLRVFDGQTSSRHDLCRRSRVRTRHPAYWCVLFSFSSLLVTSRPEVLMYHEEGVGGSDSSSALPVPVRRDRQGRDSEAQSVVSQAENLDETSPSARCCIPCGVFLSGRNSGHSQRNVSRNVSNQPTHWQAGQRPSHVDAQIRAYFLAIATKSTTANRFFFDPVLARDTTSDSASEQNSEEPRMIGDFDGSSNALWTLFKDEAKNHDDAQIYILKEHMDSALIFVRSYPSSMKNAVILMRYLTGRFIFRYPYWIRTRQQTELEAEPCR